MLASLDLERGTPWHYYVEVLVFVPCVDKCRYQLFFRDCLKGVSRLANSDWVNKGLLLWNSAFTMVYLTEFASVEVNTRLQFGLNEVSVGILAFVSARGWSHDEFGAR